MRSETVRFETSGILVVFVMCFTLFAAAAAARNFKVLHRFKGADGADPFTGLILDSAGNLYGTTVSGGDLNGGVVFKLSPNADGSWTEGVLHSFTGGTTDGFNPRADLILDETGNLYGTTASGGYLGGGNGVVFKLSPNPDGSWTQSLLYAFLGTSDGSTPLAGLIFDTAGNLYGTTALAGVHGYGVVFQLTPNADGSWTESVLYSFTGGNDGANPEADLTFDATGNLYGTTVEGGDPNCESVYGCGVVFRLTPNANGDWKERVLHRFHTAGGAYPQGTLIWDGAGALYGTAQVASTGVNGLVLKLRPNPNGAWTETVLHRFTSTRDGAFPFAGLTFDGTGNLYGTTAYGGNLICEGGSGCGAVFKLAPNVDGGWTESLLHVFQGNPAANPYGGSLVFDKAGNAYGITSNCGVGTNCRGVVFEITP